MGLIDFAKSRVTVLVSRWKWNRPLPPGKYVAVVGSVDVRPDGTATVKLEVVRKEDS